MQLSRDELLHAYRSMKTIREFEERLHIERPRGVIPGNVHLYAGQEATAVAVCMHLSDQDWLASTHRGHGHCIAKGCDVKGMMKEIYGRAGGLCKGRGGSMHIADLSRGMLGANGIVGAGAPIVCGAALSAKVLGTNGVAVVFSGDGAVNQGATLESFNLAAVWKLPAVFVCEDNGYGEATGSSWASGGDLRERARGFGLTVFESNAIDFSDIYEKSRDAIELARGGQPAFILARAKRFYGHFEGDAQKYRTREELEDTRANGDPLKVFEDRVISAALLDSDQLRQIDAEVAVLIEEAVEEAIAAPHPDLRDLTSDVYVSY
jgi:pyruvate dehydrogenase E1 component alpha subunit